MKKNKFTKLMTTISILLLVALASTGCSSQNEHPAEPANAKAPAPATEPAKEAAPASEPSNEGGTANYKDGIYEGLSPNGFGGDVKVEVEVSAGKIAQVTVTQNNETEGVGSLAVDQLPDAIVKAQSTKVDSVTGASYASTAIKEAVEDALTKAK
ncbi:FMN-binding protein [Desulfitobacterium hafniense]|uniref:FMN-binding domain-containing protein n=1 Tax=Desulfitobacterium hafniense (strain Y51) TaxID=138119 RepID=Q24QU9_DESHY|nr:FMN-binding protein [Desulfitobacterium hafniense]BAE85593.1 hypothetical protein DSY3804 [Desulfitobacterium hafniense Y51]